MIQNRYAGVPSGMVPTRMLTNTDLRLLGLDPWQVRNLERELADMGMGLGIKLPGFLKKIGKVVTAPVRFAAKKVVAPVAKRAFKIGKGVVKVGLKAAPILLPAAGAGFLALKFGPKLVSKAVRLFRKPPAQLTEAEVRRAQAVPDEAVVRYTGPEVTVREEAKPTVLETLKRIAEEAAPLIPQVVERVTAPREPAYGPTPPVVPMPTPEVPATMATAAPAMPGWLLPAAGIALFMLTRR